jgi:flagellar biosynthesis GTPase FlhF
VIDQQKLELASKKGTARWLQEYLVENLPSLFESSANEQVYQTWFDDFLQVLDSRPISKATKGNYITNIRSAIKEFDPHHPSLKIIDFGTDNWIDVNNQASDRLAQRTTKLIKNPDAVVNKAVELIKTNYWPDITAGLALLTGRRCAELLQTAQFKFKSKYIVNFTGSLKRRNEPKEHDKFDIPTLCEADLVIQAINNLRLQLGEEVQTLTNREINNKYEGSVIDRCDRHFSALIPKRKDDDKNLYTHLFKSVYGAIACHWYCPVNVPEIEFRAAILGHYKILNESDEKRRLSMASTRNYFDYKIANEFGNNINGALGIKLDLPGVEIIERFQATTSLSPPRVFKQAKFSLKPKSTSIMNQQSKDTSNSSREAVVSLQLPLSRLESISRLLNLPQMDALDSLVDWAEAAASLAQDLELDEPFTPEALTTHVLELKQNIRDQHEPLSYNQNQSNYFSSPDQALTIISNLSNSLNNLTEAWPSRKISTQNHTLDNSRPQTSLNEKRSKTSELTKTGNEALKNPVHKNNEISAPNLVRERDVDEVVTEDINRAINALFEFNDFPNRPHKQKFLVNINTVSQVTARDHYMPRSNSPIKNVLTQRQQEIDLHHQKHQLFGLRRKIRKDNQGNLYPDATSEPDIHYQKFTQVGTPSLLRSRP